MISVMSDVRWFGDGSRVIVTTRDRHLIEKDVAIYEVPTLPDHEAMQLFNQHAFKREVPDERFKEFLAEVVDHAKGLPLALKVWGSLLHKKGLIQWRRTVDQIKKNSNSEIVEKLKISYDGLEPEEQKIFLDIACFFRGHGRTQVMQILESCDFGAEYGLDVLIDKSLLFISEYGRIEMHDLIEDMGKCIVKMQKDLGKPSRIWNVENLEDVMQCNTGTMAVEAICFDYYDRKICFREEAITNMQRLRILCIQDLDALYDEFDEYDIGIHTTFNENYDSIEYLSNNLCWFVWHGYPWKLLPKKFNPTRLVRLDLMGSALHYLWNETKQQLRSLQRLYLRGSKSLKSTPDFGGMPNLEYLDLSKCESLEEVHHSLRCCRRLIELGLNECVRLERFPYVNVESLKYLDLDLCSSLEKFPEILGTMMPELEITMELCGLREIPSSILQQCACRLTEINMRNLVPLPSSICKLKGLVTLNVSCSKLESLPEEIGDLENLEDLDASDTLISGPPSSIIRLNKLKNLSFEKEDRLEDRSVCFEFPQVNEGLRSLEYLNLKCCNLIDGGIPEDIGSLSSLKKLNLSGNNFEHLPRSIAKLGALESLDLSHCNKLKELPDFTGMPNLDTLYLRDCNLIDGALPEDIGSLSSLKELDLSGNSFEHLPRSIAQLGALRTLDLSHCNKLKELPDFTGMPNLYSLNLSYCNLIDGALPEDFGSLFSLTWLYLSGNSFERLPRSIAQLGALASLDLSHCNKLSQLPEFPQQLHRINADWSNDWICSSLFQNISSLQHDISASLRVFSSETKNIPSWFHHTGISESVSVNLPENWYASDNFLGFAVCYSRKLIDITAHLIPLCDDGTSSMTQKFALLSNYFIFDIHFCLVPLAGLWDASKANGKTPNDYEIISLIFGEVKKYGVRLLYKDEPELHIGIRRSRYEDGSCSSSKKQRPLLQLFPTSPGL